VNAALAAVPGLAGGEVQAVASGETVTLSGRVSSALDALRAFRAAQQTPGVARIVDRIEFPAPESAAANPLLDGAAPEDLEPYLQYHLGRQLGDGAKVDRVRVQGRSVEITVALRKPGDRARVEAILRSSPLLRGFQVRPDLRIG
jgi:hypothetical protein